MGGDDFEKGGSGLGLRDAISKSSQTRENRIKDAIDSGAHELITKMGILHGVSNAANNGLKEIRLYFPGTFRGRDAKTPTWICSNTKYTDNEALLTDGIEWSVIVEKMHELITNEGVKMFLQTVAHPEKSEEGQRFYSTIHLVWE